MEIESLDNFYDFKEFDTQKMESLDIYGKLTERDIFSAAKLILLGLAILYTFTLIASFYTKENSNVLLDICKTIYPPLATLIIAFYFRDNKN